MLHNILLFCLLTGLRSGEACGLFAEDVISKGNLGRFVRVAPNDIRQLKSKTAQRKLPLHNILENLLDISLPTTGRLFPTMTVDKVVKRYAFLRRQIPELKGTVFHSTRKWFITQCERTGNPEHFTASIVGHQTARSENKLTYGLYSAGISDEQKRTIVDKVRGLRPVYQRAGGVYLFLTALSSGYRLNSRLAGLSPNLNGSTNMTWLGMMFVKLQSAPNISR